GGAPVGASRDPARPRELDFLQNMQRSRTAPPENQWEMPRGHRATSAPRAGDGVMIQRRGAWQYVYDGRVLVAVIELPSDDSRWHVIRNGKDIANYATPQDALASLRGAP